MYFYHLEHWLFLLTLPFFLGLFVYSLYSRKKKLGRIIAPSLVDQLTRGISHSKRNVKLMLLSLAIFIYGITLMRPQWGNQLVKVTRTGIDIVFVIDVSRSMLAEDILPSRLEKAKIQLTGFMDKIKGDRVGLVMFAGSSFVACPLTLDYNALKLFIDLLSPEMVQRQGTLIGSALQTARKCFNVKEKKHKAIVLLTDGEDHGQAPLKEAKRCHQEGIRIYTIGVGKKEGEPIPVKNKNAQVVDYLKDSRGNIVMSRPDEGTLKKIALETGGKYIFSKYGELGLEDIYQDIQKLDKKDLGSKKFKRKEDRFQYFVALLLVILIVENLLSERKKIKKEHLTGRYQ